MARINIEDCWWTDPRRSALAALVGGEELADGCAAKAWRLAQEFWKHDRKLIPKDLFDVLRFASELIRVGLAEVRGEGVYVRGSSAYLDWVNEQREAAKAGGEKSAKRPRDSKGRLQKRPSLPQAGSNESPSDIQVESKSPPSEAKSLLLPLSLNQIQKLLSLPKV